MGVSALRVGAYIAATYSQRWTTTGSKGERIPIIRFGTQRRPILKALAYGEILHAFACWAAEEFINGQHGDEVRMAIATAFKVLVVRSCESLNELME
ncbi:acyloxidase [Colletotrichum kahawae]|uniref:Acyloxidase n=1 Tax=Colletotrichum kahawae TaxID=34407 RepID=A0AAD9Y3J0_COLKA|nr:acyloxidase [Colletotrichum kahawae]